MNNSRAQLNSIICISINRMSFRDTFTRGSGSSQNLRYDDTAAYHFYITVLIVVAIPLFYTIIKTLFNPFSHIPRLEEASKRRQFRDKIERFKKQNKYNFISCSFFFKVILLCFVLYGIAVSAQNIMSSKEQMKGFDPYEMLEVEQNAPIERIKKSYRKLALLYHPDRNKNNPEASAKFIMISKAYECLTNEESKQKCLKFGNPDGAGSFNVGIALPSLLVKKQNHVFIMGIVFLLVVIVLPICLIHYHSEMNTFDEVGMMMANYQLINDFLHQHFSMKDAIRMVAACRQFAKLKTTKNQSIKLEGMFKSLDEEVRKNYMKKNFLPYVKKSMVIIEARVNDREIAVELEEDYKFIMKKTPIILKASIQYTALARSNERLQKQKQNQTQMQKKQKHLFVGVHAVVSLIQFGQYFIQGKCFETALPYEQLDLSVEECDKISRKKKQRKLTDLLTLLTHKQEQDFMLSLLTDNRASYIKQCLDYFPLIEFSSVVKVDDQTNITLGDCFQVVMTAKSNRTSNFCNSNSYPFLKMEGWYLIVSDGLAVFFFEHFTFEKLQQQFQFKCITQKEGKYSLQVRLMSDCYFGLDLQKSIKYEVGRARKIAKDLVEKEEEAPAPELSFIQSLMAQISPAEEEETSDKQDNNQTGEALTKQK